MPKWFLPLLSWDCTWALIPRKVEKELTSTKLTCPQRHAGVVVSSKAVVNPVLASPRCIQYKNFSRETFPVSAIFSFKLFLTEPQLRVFPFYNDDSLPRPSYWVLWLKEWGDWKIPNYGLISKQAYIGICSCKVLLLIWHSLKSTKRKTWIQCWVDILGRPALSWSETEEDWSWGKRSWGKGMDSKGRGNWSGCNILTHPFIKEVALSKWNY